MANRKQPKLEFVKGKYGNNWKAVRESKGMTVRDFATEVTMSYSSISKIENEIETPTMEQLYIYADKFNVSLDFLTGRTDIMQSDIQKICEYTGLSEKAVKSLASWKKLSIPKQLSAMLAEVECVPDFALPNERFLVISELLENEMLIEFAGYLVDLNRLSLEYMELDSITQENADEADHLSTQADIMRLRCKDYTDDIINAYDARRADTEKYDKLRSDAITVIGQKMKRHIKKGGL